MAPKRRRPAAAGPPAAPRVQGRRRPAANIPPGPAEKILSELAPGELSQLGFVVLEGAKYYQKEIDLAGTVEGVVTEDGQCYLDLVASGTQDEGLLRALTGRRDRKVRIHLCDTACQDLLTGEALVHGRKFKKAKAHEQAWYTNLEAVGHPGEEDEDELKRLREEERRREKERERKDDGKAPKTKKEKKRSRSESSKGKKKKKKEESDEDELEVGQKRLSSLFEDTGLDPRIRRRNKIMKKARKLGKSKKKKKKEAGSSDSGSGSTEASSSGEVVGGLFESERKIKTIARKYPGSLTSSSLGEAKESLLTTSGMAWSVDKKALAPLFTHFVRQQLAAHMSPPMLQEALTLAVSLDAMLQGRAAYACDIMSQRLKALESTSQGAHWSVGRQMELVNASGQSMTEEQESLEAARRAREANKLRALVASPTATGSKGPEGDPSKGKKGKGWKGGGKNKTDDGRGKGDARKDDKRPWQKNAKEKE